MSSGKRKAIVQRGDLSVELHTPMCVSNTGMSGLSSADVHWLRPVRRRLQHR